MPMKQKLSLLVNYLKYTLKAVNEHGVHSPFVFDLITQVIYNDKDYYPYKSIEAQQEKLLNSNKVNLPATGLKPVKYGRLLFRLVNHFQPSHILQFGSADGIETAYMAAASSSTKIAVFESAKEITDLVKENIKPLKLKSVEFAGASDSNLKGIRFVYFHKQLNKEMFLKQFYQCLETADDSAVFIVSDMYDSVEMGEAWNEIKNHERVKVTIDLFRLEIIFFRKEQVKEHFIVRF